MMRDCENCWIPYDTERKDANAHFCPKCIGDEPEVSNG